MKKLSDFKLTEDAVLKLADNTGKGTSIVYITEITVYNQVIAVKTKNGKRFVVNGDLETVKSIIDDDGNPEITLIGSNMRLV